MNWFFVTLMLAAIITGSAGLMLVAIIGLVISNAGRGIYRYIRYGESE